MTVREVRPRRCQGEESPLGTSRAPDQRRLSANVVRLPGSRRRAARCHRREPLAPTAAMALRRRVDRPAAGAARLPRRAKGRQHTAGQPQLAVDPRVAAALVRRRHSSPSVRSSTEASATERPAAPRPTLSFDWLRSHDVPRESSAPPRLVRLFVGEGGEGCPLAGCSARCNLMRPFRTGRIACFFPLYRWQRRGKINRICRRSRDGERCAMRAVRVRRKPLDLLVREAAACVRRVSMTIEAIENGHQIASE